MHDALTIGYLQAVILGLLQGLTEFLPVSSTAHMAIAPQLLLHMPDPGSAFSAVAQLGPIVAIIVYFRTDLVRYVNGVIRNPNPNAIAPGDVDGKLGWYVVIATIPIIVFGVLLQKHIASDFRNLKVIAISLIVLAIVLFWAEKAGARRTSLENITFKEAMIIGIAQVLALIPGTSRSGVTISAGLFQGLDRESAARFSFLLSIPAVTAAGIFEFYHALKEFHFGHAIIPYLVSAVVAGLFAYFVIKWFLGYMKEHNTMVFIVYRIALGVLILVLLQLHHLNPKTKIESSSVPQATVIRLASR